LTFVSATNMLVRIFKSAGLVSRAAIQGIGALEQG
jgi:hypothetical protein